MKKLHKKTIIISSYDDLKNPVYSGGGAIAVHEVAKRLAKKHRVTVITGTYTGAKNKTIDKVRYVRIGSDIFGHKIGQLIFQIALLSKIKSLQFDVWIESATPPFTFSLLPLFSKKPVYSWVNMLSSYDMRRKYFFNFHAIEKLLSKKYHTFIVPTEWVKKEIKKMNTYAEVIKIPYGFDHRSFKKHSTKKEYFLFIGRVEVNQKGLDLLLKAFSQVDKNIKLIIAGSGAEKEMEQLQKLINDNDLQEKVTLIGRVDGYGKAKLLHTSIAVIVPSRFETFSITALESIAYKKPVICFDIPQLAWIPKEFSYKAKPFSIRSLARAIETASTKKKSMFQPKKTQVFLEQFNWMNVTKQFENSIFTLS